MGVKGLWENIAKSEIKTTLRSITREFWQKNERSMVIGVDMGPFMDECINGARNAGIHCDTQALSFRNLFSRLANFRRTSADFVFVYDGLERPSVKRGKSVKKTLLWWSHSAKRLVTQFGYANIQAPAEAEAELAELNRSGRIDAVFSVDGDALVFGANRVINRKQWGAGDKKDHKKFIDSLVLDYTSAKIEEMCRLNHAGLFLYALLAGGDYDQQGLHGSGVVKSYRIAASGIGDELFQNPQNIDGWKASVQAQARCGRIRKLNTPECNVLLKMPDTFPSPATVNLYRNPITSISKGEHQFHLSFDEPYIGELAEFCREKLKMKSEDIATYFEKHVWEGVIMSLLRSSYSFFHEGTNELRTGALKVRILNCTQGGSKRPRHAAKTDYRLVVDTTELAKQTCMPLSTETSTVKTWVPEELVPAKLKANVVLKSSKTNRTKGKGGDARVTSTGQKRCASLGFIDLMEDEAGPLNAAGSSAARRECKRRRTSGPSAVTTGINN